MNDNQEKMQLCIVLQNETGVRVLKQEKANFLLKTILSSKIKFKKSENGFDIYVDEAGNQRFYKNGLENYVMFYNNNGVSAVLNDLKNDDINRKLKNQVKRFSITLGAFVLGVTLSAYAVEVYQKHNELNNGINYLVDEDLNKRVKKSTVNIELNECKNLIYSSEFLSEKEKDYLYNEDLLIDVLAISDNSRNFELREKLNNIKINKFSEEDNDKCVGYYICSEPNEINISEKIFLNNKAYKSVLTHEYIHLLQSNSKYGYIQEACAEIISSEYFNHDVDGYCDEVCNVKVLMELIGPNAILKSSFKNDTSELEDAVKRYLEPKDADKLLYLLSNSFDESVNSDVKELLEKMYNNMIDNDKPSKDMIKRIYSDPNIDRVYFNQSKKKYEEDFVLESNASNTKLENIIILDNIPKWSLKFNDKVFRKADVYESNYVDYSSIYKYEFEIKKSIPDVLVNEKYEITDLDIFSNNAEFIDNLITLIDNNKIENMRLFYKDGTIGDVVKLTDVGIFVNRHNLEEKTEPSIKKRFDFKIDRSLYKNKSDIIKKDKKISLYYNENEK